MRKNKKEYYKRAMVENQQINWLKIRNEYETTGISLKKLSQKYKNLKFDTLQKRCTNEGWVNSRKKIQRQLAEDIRKKTIEKIANTIAETQANHFKTSTKFMDIINSAVNKQNEFNTFVEKIKEGDQDGNFTEEIKEYVLDSINDKKVLNMVNAFEKLQKAQRQTLGIVDSKDKVSAEQKQKQLQHNIEIDNKKLALEEKKVGNDTSLKPVVIIEGEDKYQEWKKNNARS